MTLPFRLLTTLLSAIAARALWSGYEEFRTSNLAQDGKWPDDKVWLPRPSNKHILVVPKLKLLFCFIPKNGCTQFNKLMNALNGITQKLGNNCEADDPMFASSVRPPKNQQKQLDNFSMALMSDPSWTKAVFLRDPLQRLVSAHRSKCEQGECGGCLDENFSRGVLENLSSNDNMHYLPQRNFCGDQSTGGLGRTIGSYDFVGHISHDYASVSSQVERMLHLAMERASAAKLPSLLQLGASPADSQAFVRRLVEEHLVPASEADLQEEYFHGYKGQETRPRRQRAARPGAEGEEEGPAAAEAADAARERYFPAGGAAGPEGHNTGTDENAVQRYYQADVLTKALKYYGKDYQVLPGLEVPAWAVGPGGMLRSLPTPYP